MTNTNATLSPIYEHCLMGKQNKYHLSQNRLLKHLLISVHTDII